METRGDEKDVSDTLWLKRDHDQHANNLRFWILQSVSKLKYRRRTATIR